MQESTELYYNVNTEVPDDAPGWKRLDNLIRRWTVKRLWEEDLQRYETLRETIGM